MRHGHPHNHDWEHKKPENTRCQKGNQGRAFIWQDDACQILTVPQLYEEIET